MDLVSIIADVVTTRDRTRLEQIQRAVQATLALLDSIEALEGVTVEDEPVLDPEPPPAFSSRCSHPEATLNRSTYHCPDCGHSWRAAGSGAPFKVGA